MSLMAARWVLRNVYKQPALAAVTIQHDFEPSLIARDSISRPA
jgi:hypothetical protein